MNNYLDIAQLSVNKFGEELCGDHVKVLRTEQKTWVVLSDGLGSGVKASILATMTSQIIITMLKENAALRDVIETIIDTLPECQVRKIAYATFTIVEIDHSDYRFKVINFDNPQVFYFKKHGRLATLEQYTKQFFDKQVTISEGQLEQGDFLAAISDGVWYAGLGQTFNFGWGWENISQFMSGILSQHVNTAQTIVEKVIRKTDTLYGSKPGDDATLVGLYLRQRHAAIIFTGPPLRQEDDGVYVKRLLEFDGRRLVCGGTTGNIVARELGQEIDVDFMSMKEDVPPIGRLDGIHLLTEGILTLSKAMEYIQEAEGEYTRLTTDINGASMLALEILYADAIHFLVGQQINPFYQNPLLPTSISIRKNLIDQLAAVLRDLQKEVTIEYC